MKGYVVNNKQEQLQWGRTLMGICKKITTMGICKKITTDELPSGRTGTVHITKSGTALGQTFYIKKIFREKTSQNYIPQKSDHPTKKTR